MAKTKKTELKENEGIKSTISQEIEEGIRSELVPDPIFTPSILSPEIIEKLDEVPLFTKENWIGNENRLEDLKKINNIKKETPEQDEEPTPEVKSSFINELIVKTPPVIEPAVKSNNPPQGVHYARRNVELIDGLNENPIKTGLDALNVEDRGIYKCRANKPIKN